MLRDILFVVFAIFFFWLAADPERHGVLVENWFRIGALTIAIITVLVGFLWYVYNERVRHVEKLGGEKKGILRSAVTLQALGFAFTGAGLSAATVALYEYATFIETAQAFHPTSIPEGTDVSDFRLSMLSQDWKNYYEFEFLVKLQDISLKSAVNGGLFAWVLGTLLHWAGRGKIVALFK